jgi:hypothetical protein
MGASHGQIPNAKSMEYSQIWETLVQLSPDDARRWLGAVALLMLVIGLVLWLEYRYFRRTQRSASWLVVRCVSLVMAPVTFAAVMLPAQATSGMEGLAVFYGLALTLGPLLWFGSHHLAGRWVRPALSGAERVVLAIVGLGIAAMLGTAYLAAKIPLQSAAREIASRPIAAQDQPELDHNVGPLQSFEMPGAGRVYAQSLLARPGVRLERVDTRVNGPWYDTAGVAHPQFCLQGNDIHLLWSARETRPVLRLHWTRDGRGPLLAAWSPDLAQASEPVPFTVAFRADGVDPVAPVPRTRVHLQLPFANGKPYLAMLGEIQPGEKSPGQCLMQGYQRVRWQQEPPVDAVGIMFYLGSGQEPLRGWIERPPVTPP